MANQTNNTQDVNSPKIDAGAIVQAGTGVAGALSTAYSIYGNVKGKEDLMGRINSMYDAPYRGTDSFNSLTQSYLNYSPYRNFTMDEVGFNKGAAGMNVASTALQGAGAGAAIGSIIPGLGTLAGGLIGGVIGGIGGLFSKNAAQRKAKNTLDFANSKISEVNKYNLSGLGNRLANAQKEQFGNLKLNSGYALRGAYGGPLGVIEGPIDYSMAMQYLDMKNNEIQNKLMADGGQLHSHGSDWNTGLNYVGNGGSHEENPYDGVPMGIAPDGQPNLVEEGEVIWNNDYVFSKRLKVPKAVRNKYKLRGTKPMSFAEAVMQVNKEAEERPNDPITLRGRDAILGALAEAQEIQRAKKEAKEQQQDIMLQQEMLGQEGMPIVAARGGKLGHRYAYAGLLNPIYKVLGFPEDYFDGRFGTVPNPYETGQQPLFTGYQKKIEVPISWGHTPDTTIYKHYDTDGKNVSKEAMNWLTQIERRKKSDDFYVSDGYHRTNDALYDDLNAFYTKFNRHGDTAEALINFANRGSKGDVSNAITDLYNKYGRNLTTSGISDSLPIEATPVSDIYYRKTLPIDLLNPKSITPALLPQIKYSANNTINNIKDNRSQIVETDNNSNVDWVSRLRYVPAIGAGIGVLSDLFGWTNKPDYSQADAIAKAARGMGTISASPIGDYLTYRPMDRMFALNMLNANAGANRRAILDTAGGNRGTAMAGLLASDNNTLNNIGNLFRQAEEYNAQQREKVATFNRATNMYNSELDFNTQKANLGRDEVVMRGLQAAAALRDAIDQRVGAARSANLTNLFESLGDIGREEAAKDMIRGNRGLSYDSLGNYKGILGADGGKLVIKNKKRRK